MPRPVIMMQDGAIDELMSVVLLTTMPTDDVDYLGCLVVNGDCLTTPTVEVTRKILAFMAGLDATLPTDSFVGAVDSRAVNAFPWTYRQYSLMANLLPMLNPSPAPPLVSTPLLGPDETAALLVASAERSGRPVTILSLGPLTPLAAAIDAAGPTVLDSVAELVWMGGALAPDGWTPGDAPYGNIDTGIAPGANPNAEWNAYWDPYSVDSVFRSGLPVRMFPLGVTNGYPLDTAFFRTYIDPHRRSPLVDLAGQMYSTVAFEAGYCFWDTVTTASLGNDDLFTYTSADVVVDTDYASGDFGTITEQPGAGSTISIARSAQGVEAFYDYYVGRLTSVG